MDTCNLEYSPQAIRNLEVACLDSTIHMAPTRMIEVCTEQEMGTVEREVLNVAVTEKMIETDREVEEGDEIHLGEVDQLQRNGNVGTGNLMNLSRITVRKLFMNPFIILLTLKVCTNFLYFHYLSLSDYHPWPIEEYNEEFMKQSEQSSMDLISGKYSDFIVAPNWRLDDVVKNLYPEALTQAEY